MDSAITITVSGTLSSTVFRAFFGLRSFRGLEAFRKVAGGKTTGEQIHQGACVLHMQLGGIRGSTLAT